MAASITVLRLRDALFVAFPTDPTDDALVRLREELGARIARDGVRAVIIDVSGLEAFDSYIARSIRDTSQLIRLMGVATVLSGLDPAIAITMVEMGMLLDGITTVRDLDSALDAVSGDRETQDEDLFMEIGTEEPVDEDLLGLQP